MTNVKWTSLEKLDNLKSFTVCLKIYIDTSYPPSSTTLLRMHFVYLAKRRLVVTELIFNEKRGTVRHLLLYFYASAEVGPEQLQVANRWSRPYGLFQVFHAVQGYHNRFSFYEISFTPSNSAFSACATSKLSAGFKGSV